MWSVASHVGAPAGRWPSHKRGVRYQGREALREHASRPTTGTRRGEGGKIVADSRGGRLIDKPTLRSAMT